ncbi:MAG: phosphatidylglycerophosphate synthase [Rhodobacterales bacterium 32-66-7]|nr:MAG: phosphatidylglycerophosphate synthase [Rhodobacterales bacterium 12-65-15]OYX25703.1 MAG: phosphatidylglycerophosphate synthase [Rhodobacterales bacterium 32-66-7]
MLDGMIRSLIDPPLNDGGRWLAARGATANAVTLVGLVLGLVAAGLLALGHAGWLVVVFLLASRLADGLDGAVARAHGKTDFGGFLDIVCDFVFYSAIPLALVWRDPTGNGVAGAFLLASFYINGATFLGYAILAAERGMKTAARGEKSLYFTAGLLEGFETILFFLILAILPQLFAPLAWGFGALCLVTATARVVLAWRVFG